MLGVSPSQSAISHHRDPSGTRRLVVVGRGTPTPTTTPRAMCDVWDGVMRRAMVYFSPSELATRAHQKRPDVIYAEITSKFFTVRGNHS